MKKRNHPEVKENYKHHMEFYHPPLLPMPDIPVCQHYGSFLIKRRFDEHTGVDLYAPVGSPVYAIEDGEVVNVRYFTGEEANDKIWKTTWALDIEGFTGTICYGEIKPEVGMKVGSEVKKGQIIGEVLQVLKKDKGKAMSMLHFAIHSRAFKYALENNANPELEPIFDPHIDPTLLLIQLKNKADIMLCKYDMDKRIIKEQMRVDELIFNKSSKFKTNPYDAGVKR